jgi:hypothetical protein
MNGMKIKLFTKNNNLRLAPVQIMSFSLVNFIFITKLFKFFLKQKKYNIKYYSKRFRYFSKMSLRNKKDEIVYLQLFNLIRVLFKFLPMSKLILKNFYNYKNNLNYI